MATYECDKCGMKVNATCGHCDAPLANGSLELDDIPLSSSIMRLMNAEDALRFALSGGDDYELCFTADVADERIREVSEQLGVNITRIGQVTEGGGLQCLRGGNAVDYQDPGYRHFH